MAQAAPQPRRTQQQAQKCHKAPGADVHHDAGHFGPGGPQQRQLQEDAHEKGRQAVQDPAAEKITEASRPRPAGQHPMEGLFFRHGANVRQAFPGLVEVTFPRLNIPGELVDGHHLVQPRSLDGDMLDPGIGPALVMIVAPGGKNPVAEDKEIPLLHAKAAADALHGLLHPEDLRAVFQQDMPRLHSGLQHQAVLGRRCGTLFLHILSPLSAPGRALGLS